MRFFFSVGDPSGDQHAAHLISELRKRNPAIECYGFGGPAMKQAGCRLLYRLTDLAVMGLLHVIPLLWKFRRLVHQAREEFAESPPDAVVLVDFPGFNWWVARQAKRSRVPVYYYLPPQLWAWAPWRVERMRRLVDHVLCALPFEFDWYRRREVAATYVGHPFFDEVADRTIDDKLINRWNAAGGGTKLGVLPGSRDLEVHRNWPVMVAVLHRLHRKHPEIRFRVACYRDEHRALCKELIAGSECSVPMDYEVGQTSEVIEWADCCLMVSGSVSLELLARRTPAVVVYRVGRITRLLSRVGLNCRFISLPNLIADSEVMPEFLSAGNPDRDVERMTGVISRWIDDPAALANDREALTTLAAEAASPGATMRAADHLVRECVSNRAIRSA